MFTIKLYTSGGRQRIIEAQSFTILHTQMMTAYEVTAHGPGEDSIRFDIGPTGHEPGGGNWDWAFIENSAGKTVERLRPMIDADGP